MAGVYTAQLRHPAFLALMAQPRQDRLIFAGPKNIHPDGIDSRRRAGIAVQTVQRVLHQVLLAPPQFLPIITLKTKQGALPGYRVHTSDEDLALPDDRRGVPLARQHHFPGVVLLRPFRRQSLGLADPLAVGPSKPGPVLGRHTGHQEHKAQQRHRPSTRLLYPHCISLHQ